jgi:homoserine/homoserine lactone efflux protein
MSLDAFLAFCLTATVLCLTPGPAVLFVSSVALSRGRRAGLAAALGIVAANTFYFVLSGTGIAAVLVASSRLFTALKWAGAAYLVWLGLRMLVARGGGEPVAARPVPVSRTALRGFVVQAANPNALVFFVALVPQFIDPAAPVGLQLVILGASTLVIELLTLSLYVHLGVRARRLAATGWAGALERVGGGLLLAAGARLALARSH